MTLIAENGIIGGLYFQIKKERKSFTMAVGEETRPVPTFFFYIGTPNGVHLFDHFLWSIFQSSIRHYIYKFLQKLMTSVGRLHVLQQPLSFDTSNIFYGFWEAIQLWPVT